MNLVRSRFAKVPDGHRPNVHTSSFRFSFFFLQPLDQEAAISDVSGAYLYESYFFYDKAEIHGICASLYGLLEDGIAFVSPLKSSNDVSQRLTLCA